MCKDPRVISAYEQELANKIIYQDSIENATNNGKNIGFEKGKNIGIKEGKNIGIKEGKNIGIKEEKTEIAKKMLNENMSHELITKLTGINKKELNKIINQK